MSSIPTTRPDANAAAPAISPAKERLPSQIWFLAGNEAAERFSYYGMTSILTLYMVRHLGLASNVAVSRYSIFTSAVYLMPIFGAWIADRYWGRYHTILWLSFGYVAGHLVIAGWETGWGLATGCTLIALGAGGLKPCASAFAGDQIPPSRSALLERVYDLYYWMINLGSTASTIAIPWLFEKYGPRVAFGVPALAMAIALAVYWVGRGRYVYLPPSGPTRHGFFRVVAAAIRHRGGRARGAHWLDAARADHPAVAVAGAKAVFRIAGVFAAVAAFWALFFQYGSSWTLQADAMRRDVLGYVVPAGQVQTLDAAFVLTLIPVFSLLVYPALERRGVRTSALGKMSAGMFVMVLSFVAATGVEWALEAGLSPHVAWQIPQYFFLAVGEVLVSVTALEFAYSQAPAQMKSAIMGLWYLTIFAGNLLTAAVAAVNRFQGITYFAFFAGLMLAAAIVFALVAWRYEPVEIPRDDAAAR